MGTRVEGANATASGTLRSVGARRRELLDTVRQYANGPLLRLLHASGRLIHIEPAAHGARSLVYFVEIDGQPRMVLRAVPRWPDAWRVAHNLRHLAALSLPVPRLLAADCSLLTRLRWGFSPIVEERIEGSHVDALGRSEPAIRAVARTLARFHGVQRRRWGSPGLPRWGSYRSYQLANMARRARDLSAVLENRPTEGLVRWCREQSRAAPLDAPFCLAHNRVHSANFVIAPDGQAYAIDLLECRYGAFAVDVAWALEQICLADPERMSWFLDAYFRDQPEAAREVFERSRPFFEADYHLARATTYARRLTRKARARGANERRLCILRGHIQHLAALTGLEMTLVEP